MDDWTNITITHNDADGLVSAAIVDKYLKATQPCASTCVRHFRWNYGNSTAEIEKVLDENPNATVWLTDITLPDEFMAKYADRIMWFDHHKSAIENDKSWKANLKGNHSALTVPFYLGSDDKTPAKQVAACELVWLTLFPGTPMPPVVRAIGRYDVWDNTEETFAVHEYLTSLVAGIESDGWCVFDSESFTLTVFSFGTEYQRIVKSGKYKVDAIKQSYARQCRGVACMASYKGVTFVLGNVGGVNSTYFDSFHPDEGEYIVSFCYRLKHNGVTVSCYNRHGADALSFLKQITKGIAVTSIGGHQGACGCVFPLSELEKFLERFKPVFGAEAVSRVE